MKDKDITKLKPAWPEDLHRFAPEEDQRDAMAGSLRNTVPGGVSLEQVLADRGKTHGDFRDHARIAQRLKVVMRDELGWGVLTDMQREALEMIQHKIARVLAGNADFAEHWLDVEGYARITRERLDPESKKPNWRTDRTFITGNWDGDHFYPTHHPGYRSPKSGGWEIFVDEKWVKEPEGHAGG